MQIIGDLFNILLFVTMVGGLFTLLSCFLDRILKLPLPLWFGICCGAAYILPLTARGTWLIPPEEHDWVEGYFILCWSWAGGVLLLILLRGIRVFLGFQAFRDCPPCEDTHILDCCNQCAQLAGLRRVPSVFWGKIKHPACVLGVVHPAVILDKDIVMQLTEHELTAVLCHELMHVKRSHLALEAVLDYVCIINWFNPLVWLMRHEFSALCEIDCDYHATAALADHITSGEYAWALLRLLTLSSSGESKPSRGVGRWAFFRPDGGSGISWLGTKGCCR